MILRASILALNMSQPWTRISAFQMLPQDPAPPSSPASTRSPNLPRVRGALASRAARKRSETPCASFTLTQHFGYMVIRSRARTTECAVNLVAVVAAVEHSGGLHNDVEPRSVTSCSLKANAQEQCTAASGSSRTEAYAKFTFKHQASSSNARRSTRSDSHWRCTRLRGFVSCTRT